MKCYLWMDQKICFRCFNENNFFCALLFTFDQIYCRLFPQEFTLEIINFNLRTFVGLFCCFVFCPPSVLRAQHCKMKMSSLTLISKQCLTMMIATCCLVLIIFIWNPCSNKTLKSILSVTFLFTPTGCAFTQICHREQRSGVINSLCRRSYIILK